MKLPAFIGFSEIEIMSHSPAYVSEANSLKTIASGTGAHRWEFQFTTSQLHGDQLIEAFAFLSRLNGPVSSFDAVLPLYSQARGAVSGPVQANGAVTVGSDEITFHNYVPKIGDFFHASGHRKVYQVVDVIGNQATVFPRFIKPVANNENIVVQDMPFKLRLVGTVQKMKIGASKWAKLKFKAVEAL